jgi:hypothetical protein
MVLRTPPHDSSSDALQPPRRHAVIAGTGRAGTSFLVRFLEHCGLDTGSQDIAINERARAGLEHNLLEDSAPYVVKDPWLFAYCDQVDERDIGIDVLLVPVRDLMAASTSRVLQERVTMAEESPWSMLPPSEVHGAVEGGAVYSIDPVDEARLLAVGFHRLIHWATASGIPLILLEFPRIVQDAGYLVDALWPWLGAHCQRDQALAAFAAVADPEKVRVDWSERSELEVEAGAIDPDSLDRAALKMLLAERDAALTALQANLAGAEERLAEAESRVVEIGARLADDEQRAIEREQRLGAALEASQELLARQTDKVEGLERAVQAATAENEELRQTWSWRATGPLRAVRKRSQKAG